MLKIAIDQAEAETLCIGCGLGAGYSRAWRVTRSMSQNVYLRPTMLRDIFAKAARKFKLRRPPINLQINPQTPLKHVVWRPLHSCTASWAADHEVRYRGSARWAKSALQTHLLKNGALDSAARIAADAPVPMRNTLKTSHNRADLLAVDGSSYVRAAMLAEMNQLFEMLGRFAFVGKPCDVAQLCCNLLQRPMLSGPASGLSVLYVHRCPQRKWLRRNCARHESQPGGRRAFRYHGDGWPSYANATLRTGPALQMDYATPWGTIPHKHQQPRCRIFHQGTGESADLVCADAWYGKNSYHDVAERAGPTLILVRMPQGQAILHAALIGKYLANEDCPIADISRMQPYQESRKRLLARRLLALLLRRGHSTHFGGLRLMRAAYGVGAVAHLPNFWGTLKRIPSVAQE